MNKKAVINAVRKAFEDNLGEVVYKCWLEKTDFIISDDFKNFRMVFPSEFKARTVNHALDEEISRAVLSVVGFVPNFEYMYTNDEGNVEKLN